MNTETCHTESTVGEDLSIPVGRVQTRSAKWFTMQADELLTALSDRFHDNPSLSAAMILERDEPQAVISRDALAQHLAHPFGNALFRNRPIRFTIDHWHVPMLILPESAPLSTAIRQVLARPATHRYEPVVIQQANGNWRMIEAYDLLVEQCTQLNGTLVELRSQRAATEIAQQQKEALQEKLLVASRHAGRAEVATGVLHNVGNVLNSVNVSVAMLQRTIESSKLSNLKRTLDLLGEHRDALGTFFTNDDRAKHVLPFLEKLDNALREEQSTLGTELQRLVQSVEHIKQIVQMQQDYARNNTFVEHTRPASVVEEALRINLVSFDRHNVKVTCEFEDIPPLPMDKHKVLQVLVNLISNAKNATKHQPIHERQIHIQIDTPFHDGRKHVRFSVRDNGVGISADHLPQLFGHGFTTRKEGHGFGLHSSANAASEMGGTLTAHSDGPGHGATFHLEIPVTPALARAA